MSRRYYPGTRERLTRAFDEGVKSDGVFVPYAFRNSGAPLRRAFVRGWCLANGGVDLSRRPVADLSAEFADVIAEVEPALAAKLERAA